MGDPKLAKELFERVYLIRACEEKIRKHYAGNEMKTPVHLCNGSEGIAAGVMSVLPPKTKIFGTYRNHGLYLATTNNTDAFFAELYGRETGCARGLAGSMHLTDPNEGLYLTSAVVGTTIPVAVGAAFANKYKGSKDFVAAFFGDGAIEEGVFWESLNFACLHELRILFVCENNDLAIHTPGKDRRGFKSISEAVSGFKCHIASGLGHSPLQVRELAQILISKIEKELKPAFLELEYFRILEHVGVNEDFQAGYRLKPSDCSDKDPLCVSEKEALKAGVKQDEINQIKGAIDNRISESVAKAEKAPFPKEKVLHDYLFA